jgi:hypothetical protein
MGIFSFVRRMRANRSRASVNRALKGIFPSGELTLDQHVAALQELLEIDVEKGNEVFQGLPYEKQQEIARRLEEIRKEQGEEG